jgi:hypothetical protein
MMMRQISKMTIWKDRKRGNEQKSRGHRNESNRNDENETQRREAFEAVGNLTTAMERAAEKHREVKGEENKQNDKR